MGTIDYRKKMIEKIDLYLMGSLTEKEISSWAQKIIITKEWDNLPPKIKEAFHILFDLHDKDKEWTPSRGELLKLKEYLANQGSPSQTVGEGKKP